MLWTRFFSQYFVTPSPFPSFLAFVAAICKWGIKEGMTSGLGVPFSFRLFTSSLYELPPI